MYLLEREHELMLMQSTLTEGDTRSTKMLSITGSAGTGKTELLGAFARGLENALLLSAVGSHAERGIEFGVMQQLCRWLGGSWTSPGIGDGPVRPAAGEQHQPPWVGADGGFDSRTMGRLADLLVVEAARRPVVIMIDDVHEADHDSLRGLAWLQRRFRFSRVVVVTSQPTRRGGAAVLGSGLNVRQVPVSPLSPAAVQTFVASRLGEEWAVRHATEVHRITGGNPGLMTALMDDQLIVRDRSRPGTAVVIGDAFIYAYASYVRRLGPSAEAAARRLALRGEPGRMAHAALPGSDDAGATEGFTQAVNELALAGLLCDGTFPHAAARLAVLGPASVEQRGADHGPGLNATSPKPLLKTDRRTVAPSDARRTSTTSDSPPVFGGLDGPSRLERNGPSPQRGAASGTCDVSTEPAPSWCDLVDFALNVEPFALLGAAVRQHVEDALARSGVPLEEATDRRAAAVDAGQIAAQAETKRARGDLSTALQLSHNALAVLPAPQWGPLLAAPLSVAVAANTVLGRLDDASATVRAVSAEVTTATHFGVRLLWSIGYYHLAEHRPEEALETFFHCGQSMVNRGLDLVVLAPWRSGAAEAQMMLGNHRAARALATAQLERTGADVPRTRGNALRVLALTVQPAERLPLLHESAVLLRASGDRVGLAWTLRELFFAHRAVGSARQARDAASESLELARSCGVQGLLADALLAEQFDELVPTHTDTLLSEAERRVAVLAAQGQTNRQISTRLFVTVSTVEQHLTRTYRKLGLTGRPELAEWIRRAGVTPVSCIDRTRWSRPCDDTI